MTGTKACGPAPRTGGVGPACVGTEVDAVARAGSGQPALSRGGRPPRPGGAGTCPGPPAGRADCGRQRAPAPAQRVSAVPQTACPREVGEGRHTRPLGRASGRWLGKRLCEGQGGAAAFLAGFCSLVMANATGSAAGDASSKEKTQQSPGDASPPPVPSCRAAAECGLRTQGCGPGDAGATSTRQEPAVSPRVTSEPEPGLP